MAGDRSWFAWVGTARSIGMVQVPCPGIVDDPRLWLRPEGHQADMDEQGQG
jgi:hypothetical protein